MACRRQDGLYEGDGGMGMHKKPADFLMTAWAPVLSALSRFRLLRA